MILSHIVRYFHDRLSHLMRFVCNGLSASDPYLYSSSCSRAVLGPFTGVLGLFDSECLCVLVGLLGMIVILGMYAHCLRPVNVGSPIYAYALMCMGLLHYAYILITLWDYYTMPIYAYVYRVSGV